MRECKETMFQAHCADSNLPRSQTWKPRGDCDGVDHLTVRSVAKYTWSIVLILICRCKGQWRYYMDPTMSVLISLMIFAIGTPLSK